MVFRFMRTVATGYVTAFMMTLTSLTVIMMTLTVWFARHPAHAYGVGLESNSSALFASRTCYEIDPKGRLIVHPVGIRLTEVMSWLRRSDGGTKRDIPMPPGVSDVLASLPACVASHRRTAGPTTPSR